MNRHTTEQLRFLERGYREMGLGDLTLAFNKKFKLDKSESSVRSTLRNHRFKCGRKPNERIIRRRRVYTDEMIRFLAANYKTMDKNELTYAFNARFGTDKRRGQILAALKNRGIKSGRNGRFERGLTPWNKGTKGVMKPNSGNFKKGNVPANRNPLGTERIDSKDGYIYIKVAETDPYTGFKTRYKLKHVHIWEQAFGPVPNGMCLIFRDSNRSNVTLENLELVSRLELSRMNKRGYKKTPAELKPTVLAIAKLEAKVSETRRKRLG